jgi:cell wall-associated NlpC family hydrolase
MTSERIVAEARTWLGTRFHHQGRVKHVGVDCAGLVVCVAQAVGLSLYDCSDYTRIPDGELLKQLCDQQLTHIARSDIAVGDVLLFRIEREPQHLAIVGNYEGDCNQGDLSMIHAYAPARCVIECRLDDVWMNRLVAAYRLSSVH